MAEVFQFPTFEYYAQCPVCGSDSWLVHTNKGPSLIKGIYCKECLSEMVMEGLEIERGSKD